MMIVYVILQNNTAPRRLTQLVVYRAILHPLGAHWAASGAPVGPQWQPILDPKWQKLGFQLAITG